MKIITFHIIVIYKKNIYLIKRDIKIKCQVYFYLLSCNIKLKLFPKQLIALNFPPVGRYASPGEKKEGKSQSSFLHTEGDECRAVLFKRIFALSQQHNGSDFEWFDAQNSP